MKILLIAPPLHAKEKKKISPRHPPYILASTGSILEQNNFEVEIYDAFAEHASIVDILKVTEEYNPQLIGLAGAELDREIFIESIKATVQAINNKFSKLMIVLIGINDSNMLSEIMKEADVCHAILGDPEEAMLELALCINEYRDKDLFKISGLVIKRDDKISVIGEKRISMNLDLLPYPTWHLVDLKRYPVVPHRYNLSYPYLIIASRGCPWNRCAFCNRQHISVVKASRYRVRSPKNVVSEIDFAIKKYGIKEVQFGDASFNTNIKWLTDFRDTLQKYKINIRWSCLARIDRVSQEVLKVMYEAGCWSIIFGIESSCQRLLDIIDKGYRINQAERTIRWCREVGIEAVGSFLIGLPGEEPHDVMNSVKFAKEIGLDYAQFFITKWYNIPTKFKMYGRLDTNHDYLRFDYHGYPFIPYAYKNLNHLKKTWQLAYLKFYSSPRVILRHLRKINSFEKLKKTLSALLILVKISIRR